MIRFIPLPFESVINLKAAVSERKTNTAGLMGSCRLHYLLSNPLLQLARKRVIFFQEVMPIIFSLPNVFTLIELYLFTQLKQLHCKINNTTLKLLIDQIVLI